MGDADLAQQPASKPCRLTPAYEIITRAVDGYNDMQASRLDCKRRLALLTSERGRAVAQLNRTMKPAKSAMIKNRIRDLVTESIGLEATMSEFRTTQLETKDIYMSATNTLARMQCYEICDLIQRKLPRELRDLVYSYLLGGQTTFVAPVGRLQEGRTLLPRDAYNPAMGDLEIPAFWLEEAVSSYTHIFRVEFVGLATLKEIAESWYRLSTFIVDDCDVMSWFLTGDPWGLIEDNPAKHLRTLRLSIPESSIRAYAMKIIPFRQNRRGYLRFQAMKTRDFGTMSNFLAFVAVLETAVKVQIHITPGPDLDREQLAHFHPVEPWNKYQGCFEVLLDGLVFLAAGMDTYEVDGRKLEVCLESQGKCWVTRENAVWSPLGWLLRTLEWEAEQRGKAMIQQ